VLGRFGGAQLDRALRPYFRDAPALLAPFVALMRREPMPAGHLDVGGDALATASGVMLRALAEELPTLWIFDDLHDAPAAALRHFEAMARVAANHRILIVATARPGLPDRITEQLARTGRLTRMSLEPLSPEAVAKIVGEAVDDELRAEELAGPIATKSGGNPYFLFSILAALRAEGALSGPGAGERIVIPSEIRDLVGSRLRDLSRTERMVLDAAAVQGMRFDADRIAAVLEQPIIGVLQELAEMERQRGIVRAAGRLYRFGHSLLQEVVYTEMPVRLRGEYHLRLADARAQSLAETPTGEEAEYLAHHYLRGALPERALPYLDTALDHVRARYMHEIALDLIDRALELDELPEAERMELVFQRIDLLFYLRRRDVERTAITGATQLAEKLGDPALRARAWAVLGRWLQVVGREPEALDAIQRAAELAELSGDRGLLASIVTTIGAALGRMRRSEEAVEEHRRAYRIAREIGDKEIECTVAHQLGNVLRMLNRYDEAADMYEHVIDLAQELSGDDYDRNIHGSLGVLRSYQGRWEDAESELREHIEFARRFGLRRREASGTGNLGICLTDAGRIGEARALLDRYQLLCDEQGYLRSEAVAAVSRAHLEFLSGHLPIASELAEDGRRRALAAHAPQLVAQALNLLGKLALAAGDSEDAASRFAAAADAYRAMGDLDRTAYSLIDGAAAEELRGDSARARALLDEAVTIGETLATTPRLLLALARRARLGGDPSDLERARALWETDGALLTMYDRIETAWLLYGASADPLLLDAARAHLTGLLESTAPEDRAEMRESLPLYVAVAG